MKTCTDPYGHTRCVDCGALVDPQRKPHDCLYTRLRAAVPAGIELTEAEDRWLHWLSGFDRDSVDPLVSMFARLRADKEVGRE